MARPVAPLKGKVAIEGKSFPVCIRPQLARGNLVICNFRADQPDDLIYQEGGPHIRIEVADLDFVSLVSIGSEVEFPPPFSSALNWHGTLSMLQGRAACDLPSEQRHFERLSVRALRLDELTKFAFDGILGKRLDSGNWPETLRVNFWFDVPDDELNQFIVGPEANQLFRKMLQGQSSRAG